MHQHTQFRVLVVTNNVGPTGVWSFDSEEEFAEWMDLPSCCEVRPGDDVAETKMCLCDFDLIPLG